MSDPILSGGAEPVLPAPPVVARCVNHDAAPMAVKCQGCARPICEVCAFRFGNRAWCAECMTAGPSADQRSKATTRGMISIGLAVLGFVIVIAIVVAAVAGGVSDDTDRLLGVVWTGCGLAGLAFGLLGREGRTHSVLPTIGVVVNSLLVGLQVFFILRNFWS